METRGRGGDVFLVANGNMEVIFCDTSQNRAPAPLSGPALSSVRAVCVAPKNVDVPKTFFILRMSSRSCNLTEDLWREVFSYLSVRVALRYAAEVNLRSIAVFSLHSQNFSACRRTWPSPLTYLS